MTSDFEKLIEKTLTEQWDLVRADIIANYDRKGMRTTGKLAESLEVVYRDRTVTLMGNQYAEQLEYGRRPSSKMPPLQGIYDWIINKGIISRAEKESKIRGLAFIIARKIQRDGYNRANHGGVNLISEILTDKRIKDIIDLVGKNLMSTFEAEILTFYKKLSV